MRLKVLLAGMVLLFANLTTSQADTVIDTSFTTAEGFVDGGIGFGGANPDIVVGQGGILLSDTATNGEFNGASGFQRSILGWNPSDDFDVAAVQGFDAGATIEIEFTGLNFDPTGSNVGVFGLANVNPANILGGSQIAGGGQFVWNAGESQLYIDTNTNFAQTQELATGVANATDFDYLQVWTALGGGVYDIEHFINGSSIGVGAGITPNFGNGSPETAGFAQDFGGSGTWGFDGVRVEFTDITIPEPTSAIFGLGLIVALTSKRRRR